MKHLFHYQCWCRTNWYVHWHWRHVGRCWREEERFHSELCSSDAEMSPLYGAEGGKQTALQLHVVTMSLLTLMMMVLVLLLVLMRRRRWRWEEVGGGGGREKQLPPFSFYNLTSCRNSMYFCIKQWWKLWLVEIQRLPLRTWELQCVNSPHLRSLHKEPDLHKSLRYYKCTLVFFKYWTQVSIPYDRTHSFELHVLQEVSHTFIKRRFTFH